jgi:LuxR family maltose regulon positive regulatory protein
MEVDPNPTSSNMIVQAAIQRAKIQTAQGNFAEALANIQSIRALHLRRPSGQWKDQDLLAYEVLLYIRMGDWVSAEQRLNESESIGEHGLSQLARAEILLLKEQPELAEEQLSSLVSQYPNGIQFEPLMRTRVLWARSLFDQHKINQALQVIKEAIRLAAPERFFYPFLEGGAPYIPLLSLVLQTESLTRESQAFLKELLRLFEYTGEDSKVPQAEIDTLSASASISPREQEVLRLISAGHSNREIAGKLSISESTVKTHVGNIYHKLNVNSRIQAITCAKELKLV